MTLVHREYAWDIIIPSKAQPIIVLPGGDKPIGALSTRSGIFVRRGKQIYHLAKSEAVAARISSFTHIIVAEADEGLLRQTKIVHHWQELTVSME